MQDFLTPFDSLPSIRAHWIPRIPEANVLGDREFALRNLAPHHDSIIAERFPHAASRHHAEQIHGNNVVVVGSSKSTSHPGADGLITNIPDQLLAIYVADCAAIYIADPITKSIALLHSGKKGTELNILSTAVHHMSENYGTDSANLICILSPCIRPPHYETDFATTIHQQAVELGIKNFHDSSENTASDLTRHYSYRSEKGQTGRMLALLSILPLH